MKCVNFSDIRVDDDEVVINSVGKSQEEAMALLGVVGLSASTQYIVKSNVVSVTVNSALTAPTASASLSTVDQVQSSSLTSSVLSAGSSPYLYQWLVKAPGAGSYSSIGGATSSSYSFVTSSSTAAGVWNFELQVTDSATTPVVVMSAAISVTVNVAPTAAIAPVGPLTLTVGQVQAFTATASGGSGTINYQWYLDGGLVGSNSATYSCSAAGTSHTITCTVTDSASNPVTSPASNAVSVTVNPVSTATPVPTLTPTSTPTPIPTATPTPTKAASPSPTVPEFPAQLIGITLVASMIVVLAAFIIAKKKK
jgi:hypothetical protein